MFFSMPHLKVDSSTGSKNIMHETFEIIIVIVMVCVLKQFHCQTSPIVVQTNLGFVQGKTVTTLLGKEVDVFLGIPYAEPPLGTLRFKRTQPIRPWKGIFNATTDPNSCFQKKFGFKFDEYLPFLPRTKFSEDCLTLNIWVPKKKPDRAAVMVFIYGGGHAVGSTSCPMYEGSVLATEEQVIVVSMNYRTGSLGFLFLNHTDVPGNAGLYDQNLALRWIKDNIANFGGDPEKIVLFGQSSGAASVGIHLLSPLSSKIAKRAILQSGSPSAYWNTQDKDIAMTRAMFIVDNLGCDRSNMSTIIRCLQTAPAEEIVDNEFQREFLIFSYLPVIDGEIIPNVPQITLQNGRFSNVSIMTGSVKDESGMFLMLLKPFSYLPVDDVAISTRDILEILESERIDELTSIIAMHLYTGHSKASTERTAKNALMMIALSSDLVFNCPLVEFETYYAMAKNNVFKYYFPYHVMQRKTTKWMGVTHGEELPFIFGDPFRKERHLNYTKNEEILSRRFMRYWANFARTGHPNTWTTSDDDSIFWPQYTTEEKEYLILAPNSTAVGRAFREKACAFWTHLKPQLKKFKKRLD